MEAWTVEWSGVQRSGGVKVLCCVGVLRASSVSSPSHPARMWSFPPIPHLTSAVTVSSYTTTTSPTQLTHTLPLSASSHLTRHKDTPSHPLTCLSLLIRTRRTQQPHSSASRHVELTSSHSTYHADGCRRLCCEQRWQRLVHVLLAHVGVTPVCSLPVSPPLASHSAHSSLRQCGSSAYSSLLSSFWHTGCPC